MADGSLKTVDKTKRISRWYFGGIASAMAACCTHPLDLLKVHLQTQQGKNISMYGTVVKVARSDGILGFYNGLSASVTRQLTYSMTRFAVYDIVNKQLTADGRKMPFYEKVVVAGTAGFIGGFVGTPADMINVRMQNDVKLPTESRRNYKHVFDGLYQVAKQDGPSKLFNGATMASTRAVCVTVGQIACYDQIKGSLLNTPVFPNDGPSLHFTASFLAGGIATLLTMPLDVMKTRMMNASPGQYKSILACAVDIAKNGPLGFFKGFLPAFVRLGPHTILTFMFLEQIRMNFGDPPKGD